MGCAADQGFKHAKCNILFIGHAPWLGAQLVVGQRHEAVEIPIPKLLDRGASIGPKGVEQMRYGIHGGN
jgi:hypothetical protein